MGTQPEPNSSVTQALTVSDLVFSPQANHNFSRILTDLKKSNLSITNRLRSIKEDAAFVSDVAAAFNDRPLVANERCGSWYIRPDAKAGSAYFKSTDGHTGQWKFSTRRLNTHLLRIIGENDGCIIVDSTRRGKRMPDALSKTVPIWCCVMNRALFPHDEFKHKLYTPPNAVSESEHAQIEARIPEFSDSFKQLGMDLGAFEQQIKKPLRPVWVTQESQLVHTDEIFEDFHPIICCTSSRRVTGGEMSEGGYIQGAGDDTENWAFGLTPPIFWRHENQLMLTPEADLQELVISLVESSSKTAEGSAPKQVAPCVFVGPLSIVDSADANLSNTCTICLVPQTTQPDTWVKSQTHMEMGIGKYKTASRNLRNALPQICGFARAFFTGQDGLQDPASSTQKRVLVLCETGRDLSVGVALALVCHLFDDAGRYTSTTVETGFNKTMVKVRLGRIMTNFPEANPSRNTLQSVNSFLMG